MLWSPVHANESYHMTHVIPPPRLEPMSDHNSSLQTGVARNPDPALAISHEHTHQHINHSQYAAAHIQDDAVYTTGTTADRSNIPTASPQDHLPSHAPREKRDVKGSVDVVDAEKGSVSAAQASLSEEADPQSHQLARLYMKWKPLVHAVIFMLFTGWWIASLVLHRHDKNWLIPFLLWLAITLRLLLFYVPVTIVTRPMHWTWNQTGVRFAALIPDQMKLPAGAALTVAVILVG